MQLSIIIPAGNTGMEVPYSGIHASIDWIAVTFPESFGVDLIQHMIAGSEEWEDCQTGWRNYDHSARWGHCRMAWGGQTGIHVSLSGQGVAQMLNAVPMSWENRFNIWSGMACKFTRVDVAFDDFDGLLSLDSIWAKIENREFTSNARIFSRVVELGSDAGMRRTGDTIYVGQRSAASMVRFYDKGKLEKVHGPWIRAELVLREQNAQAAVKLFLEQGQSAWAGLLTGHIAFREAGTSCRRDRQKVSDWWKEFCGGVAKVALKLAGAVRTVARVVEWAERSLPAMLAVVARAGYDVRWYRKMVETGNHRMKSKHRNILRASGLGAYA